MELTLREMVPVTAVLTSVHDLLTHRAAPPR
jgi:hypothetical protein